MPDVDMGRVIKSLRMERAWSQEQLADIAGLSVRTVQRIEQGQAASLETLKALAASFNLPVARLSDLAQPENSDTNAMTDASIPAPPSSRPAFHRQLVIFVLVMGGLTAVNLIRHPGHPWVIYPLIGWGVILAWKGWRAYRSDSR